MASSWAFSCQPSFSASISSPPFSARVFSSPLSWHVSLRRALPRASARVRLLLALHPRSPALLPLPRSLRSLRPAPRPPAGIIRCRLQNCPSRYPFHPPVGESLGPGKKRAHGLCCSGQSSLECCPALAPLLSHSLEVVKHSAVFLTGACKCDGCRRGQRDGAESNDRA